MIGLKDARLLVIAPHPDDEVLGCAGLIHRIKAAGGKVFVLFLTLGTTADYSPQGISTSQTRNKEIKEVMKYLRIDDFEIAFPGNKYHLKLDQLPVFDLIETIEKKSKVSIANASPTILATSQVSDYNQDHSTVAKASVAATRPAPHDLKPFLPLVLSYEFAANSWNMLNSPPPNFYVSLSKEDLKAKIKAMQIYKSQIRRGFHTRSAKTIESLAKLRGAQVGCYAAEAFYCYRFFI